VVKVVVLEEVRVWVAELDHRWPRLSFALEFPLSSSIMGSRFAIRELRVKCQGHQLRVLYAFDPARNAVAILGGDKTGDDRFYGWAVPRARKTWMEYLEDFSK
jgi:hypothetical protein